MSRRYCTILLLPVALVATTAACGDDDDGDPAAADDDTPTIVATTSIWADVTSNVACGGLADVRTIISIGGDPHSYEPSLKDREVLEDAALIVTNGLALEESLDDTLDAAERSGATVFRFTDVIEPLPVDDGADVDHEEEDDDGNGDELGHGGGDPHVWFDPSRVAAALPALRDALVDAGLDAAALDDCVDAYRATLRDVDARVDAALAAVPDERRLLVTNHEALTYFAEHYDFEILGAVIPSSSTLAEASPAELQELADRIEETGVPAIFAETQHSSEAAAAIAAALTDVAVVTLHTDSLGPSGSGAETYVGLLETDARLIAEALS